MRISLRRGKSEQGREELSDSRAAHLLQLSILWRCHLAKNRQRREGLRFSVNMLINPRILHKNQSATVGIIGAGGKATCLSLFNV